MVKIKILHLNGFKEEYKAESSGVTAIGYLIYLSKTKKILIHPCQVRKIEIEGEDK